MLTPKRRWAQFSLLTLFAVATISAITIWSFRYVLPAGQRWYARRSLIQAVEHGDLDAFEEAVGAIERIQNRCNLRGIPGIVSLRG